MKATLESAPSAGAPADEDSADDAFGTAFGPAAASLLRRLERTAVSPFGLQPRVRFSIGERAETNGRMIFLPLESLDASECGDASVQSGAFDACRKDPAKQDGNSAARAAYLRASGLHEAFHVRYSDFRVFSQIARLSPQALLLANIFEDVRVDRLGLALHPEYHLARAADLQRLAFHGRGVFAEGAGKRDEIVKYIKEKAGIKITTVTLGHIQRGGSPTMADRTLAAKFALYAVDLIMSGKRNRVVGIHDNKIIDMDIGEALAMPRVIDKKLHDAATILAL